MLPAILGLWRHVSKRRQTHLLGLALLMIIASFTEMLSIGAVVPFLAVLTAPDKIFQLEIVQPLVIALGINAPAQLILPITIIFASASLLAGVIRLILVFASTRVSYAIGSELGLSIYRKTLYQPYAVHISRNSSSIVNILSIKLDVVVGAIILNGITFIANTVMIVAVLCALFYINFSITLITFVSFGAVYLIVMKLIRNRILGNGYRISNESTHLVKLLQEALGAIRDILINGYQEGYCKIYKESDKAMRNAQAMNHSIGNSPRFVMESFALLFISMLAYFLVSQDHGIVKAIPVMGTIALGAQRLLPMIQQAYSMWVGMLAAKGSLDDVLGLLNQTVPIDALANQEEISFTNCIELQNVTFSYDKKHAVVLNQVNLTIKKGSRIGIIGKTGSGKTTLVDLILGLLFPVDGHLSIDGVNLTQSNIGGWQKNIAHVPQTIFLADATIAENIAFGISPDELDYQRLKEVSDMAQLTDFIASLADGLNTKVGERGVQLSGGQRQRIGIARALYKKSKVIIFDEATSALDDDTERAVMDVINSLSEDLTILIVAHRLSTIKNCDHIVEIKNGNLLDVIKSGKKTSKH